MAPFDPDELKRRKWLAPDDGSDEDESDEDKSEATPETTPDNSASLDNRYAPSDATLPAEHTGSGDVPTGAQLSPAMQKYQQVMESRPQQQDYKPSKLRQVGAVAAGILSGVHHPAQGFKVASEINQAPYARAMGGWQSQLEAAGANMSLEEKAQTQNIAQQRAAAYSQTAQARQKAADAETAYHQAQAEHMPWQPQSEEEAIALAKAKNADTGWHPQSKEEYQEVHPVRDPVELENLRAKHESERQALALKQQRELEGIRQGGENARQAQRLAAPAKASTHQPTPQEQSQAEQLAAEELYRTNPEHRKFIQPKSSGGMFSKASTTQIKQGDPKDPAYAKFLQDLANKKREILGKQNTGSWEIKEENE